MKRTFSIALALATAFALVLPAGANERLEPASPAPTAAIPDAPVYEGFGAWFVELASPPGATGTSRARLANEKRDFRSAAAAAGIAYTERFAFDTLFNGLSVDIAPGHLFRLAQLPQVKAIHPVQEVQRPTTTTVGPDMATAIQMTGADVAQSELGLDGSGIKVAVMDTGIDYDHPDLGGCFGSGCRVAYGWDFVGDDFNADPGSPAYNPIPVPGPDPDDCQGHGTHVAGIVGANGDVVGVAPGVTFGAYRVFGCDGSTTTDIMIAAMEMALADGMDILNMSIGSAFSWPQGPTAVASNLLVDAGMVVVASIGNSGASGTFSAGSPGLGEKVIGVAAFENTLAVFPVVEVDGDPIGFSPLEFSAEPPTEGTEEIVFIGRACNADSLEADPDGKVAMAVRGECAFSEKANNAIAAGATAVIIHNNAPANFSGTLGAPPAEPQIVVSISGEDGLAIRALLAEGPVEMTWTDGVAAFPNPGAGLIASFSAYGLAPDLTLKPDIGAPGGNIWSTYPLEKGGFANLGGTSMSAPHVAGAAALLLQAEPSTPTASVRDVLQNSAEPADWWGAPGLGLMEPVHRQGAGMLQIDKAILQNSLITPGKLALGESEAGEPVVKEIRIHNRGDAPVTYTLGADSAFGCCSAAIATTGTMAEELGYWLSAEVIEFSVAEVTVPAGGHADVTVTIYPEAPFEDFDLVQYGGWLTVTPDDDSGVLRVPYAGFIGDYQSLQVLTPSAFGVFPALGVTADGSSFGLAGPGHVYSMEGLDIPHALVHLHHQSRMLAIDVYRADGSNIHPVFSSTGLALDYLPRNASNAGFFAFAWDGTRMQSVGNSRPVNVPDGEYFMVVSVLKALGDTDNPDHWETWTSPTFEIDRPGPAVGPPPGRGGRN